MKVKHNKKRNTAFLYESLIKEITRNIISENNERKKKAIGIVKNYFSDGMPLKKELDLYRSLYESNNLERLTCEKIMKEVPSSFLHLGDSYSRDFEGARNAGWSALLYGKPIIESSQICSFPELLDHLP